MFMPTQYPSIRAIGITKGSQDLFEYKRENDMETDLFPVGCIFKSFLAVLVGIALYEGKIHHIEDRVIDYVSHEDALNNNWYSLKIQHALSKTTGLIWSGPGEPLPADMRKVMELSFKDEPGASFSYKPDPQIIVYLLEEVYESNIIELFRNKLASCLKNRAYEWDRADIQGMKVSGEMLREFGQLILNKGTIHGKRLFTEDYYEQMTTAYSSGGFPEGSPYGLGWWIGHVGEDRFIRACGFGGQILAVLPSKGIVISVFSDMDRPHPENLQLLYEAMSMGKFSEGS